MHAQSHCNVHTLYYTVYMYAHTHAHTHHMTPPPPPPPPHTHTHTHTHSVSCSFREDSSSWLECSTLSTSCSSCRSSSTCASADAHLSRAAPRLLSNSDTFLYSSDIVFSFSFITCTEEMSLDNRKKGTTTLLVAALQLVATRWSRKRAHSHISREDHSQSIESVMAAKGNYYSTHNFASTVSFGM